MKRQILFVAYYYAILLCAYVFVFQVLTGVLMLYSLAYHLLIFLLFILVHMSVFLMQCSCQPKFHVRDNKVLTYLLIYDLIDYQKSAWVIHIMHVVYYFSCPMSHLVICKHRIQNYWFKYIKN